MFGKHAFGLALLVVASTSGTVLAAQHVNDPAAHASRHRPHVTTLEHPHHVTPPDSKAAETMRFFDGHPPESWPYPSD